MFIETVGMIQTDQEVGNMDGGIVINFNYAFLILSEYEKKSFSVSVSY